jgi:hypothetical protein
MRGDPNQQATMLTAMSALRWVLGSEWDFLDT